MSKEIKVGVVGVQRGMSFVNNAALCGLKLVALCDVLEDKLLAADVGENVARYTDYDEFLTHDSDAVILANYFHEHAPFAIKALRAGKHVLSETACCKTIAEGVELAEAVEDSGLIYMLAENYPYIKCCQELRRIYQSGELGRVTYAEGEYNHPFSPRERNQLGPGANHWRNLMPPSYYCTHAVAPLMHITGLMPLSVVGLAIPAPEVLEGTAVAGDPGFVSLCQMENGAAFRLFGLVMPGHSIYYRIHGTKGAAETVRGPGYWGSEQLRVWHEEWDASEKYPTERVYKPDWPSLSTLAEGAGHGGGDFWVEHYFSEAIRTGTQPFLDVYRGVAMSATGILAWRSALVGGASQAMPDFKNKDSRKKYLSDTLHPFHSAENAGEGIPQGINGRRVPTAEDFAAAERDWAENE